MWLVEFDFKFIFLLNSSGFGICSSLFNTPSAANVPIELETTFDKGISVVIEFPCLVYYFSHTPLVSTSV